MLAKKNLHVISTALARNIDLLLYNTNLISPPGGAILVVKKCYGRFFRLTQNFKNAPLLGY